MPKNEYFKYNFLMALSKISLPIRRSVSYVITAFNKERFVNYLLDSFIREGGSYKREYIVIDDGSTDNTVSLYKKAESILPGPIKIIRQSNMGASHATNLGVKLASHSWIRLVDGDDLVIKGSTENLMNALYDYNSNFAYGDLDEHDYLNNGIKDYSFENINVEVLSRSKGLKRFIKNCPANSSSILVSKQRFMESGGCDETLVSPDQMLFLRLFQLGGGLRIPQAVAVVPKQAPGRLAEQIKRSRYDSICALIRLISENPDLENKFKQQAYRRAMSRAYNYHKYFGGNPFSKYLYFYIFSKLFTPKDVRKEMSLALMPFTFNGSSDRPVDWQTGAAREGKARVRIN